MERLFIATIPLFIYNNISAHGVSVHYDYTFVHVVSVHSNNTIVNRVYVYCGIALFYGVLSL